MSGSTCVSAGANKNNTTCGGGGITCVDCTQNSQTCDPTALTCASWQYVFTEPGHDPLPAAWAVSPGEAWFAGVRSSLVHFTQTQPGAASTNGRAYALFAVGDAGSATVYLAGSEAGQQGLINVFGEPWDGGDSPGIYSRPTNSFAFYTVFPAGDEVYVAGRSSVSNQTPMVFKRDGGTWTDVTPATLTGAVNDGFGVGRGDYYLVTSASVLAHKTASGFSTVQLGGYPSSIWGTAQGTLWIAGAQFFARVTDAGVQRLDAGNGGYWNSIWAADDSAVYLAGSDQFCGGMVVRYDGTSLRRTCLGPNELLSIHGTSAADVWATDLDGGIWHYGP